MISIPERKIHLLVYSQFLENGTLNFRYNIVSKHISTNYKLDTTLTL